MDKLIYKQNSLPIKIAITENEQQTGLMYQKWPPPMMAFPSDKPAIRKFWMKNTPSPLDIIFCNSNTIVGIEKGKPFSSDHVGPDCLVDLVVELPFGTAQKLGMRTGDPISISYSLQTIAKMFELGGLSK